MVQTSPSSQFGCRLLRDREDQWLREDKKMQNHLKAKWKEYQSIVTNVREAYAGKTDIIYLDIIEAIEKKIEDYDFTIQLDAFCQAIGRRPDHIRNLIARLLVSLPEGARYPTSKT